MIYGHKNGLSNVKNAALSHDTITFMMQTFQLPVKCLFSAKYDQNRLPCNIDTFRMWFIASIHFFSAMGVKVILNGQNNSKNLVTDTNWTNNKGVFWNQTGFKGFYWSRLLLTIKHGRHNRFDWKFVEWLFDMCW